MPSFSSIAAATGVAIFALAMVGTTSASKVENAIQGQQEGASESANAAGYAKKESDKKNEPVAKVSNPQGWWFGGVHWA